jgi:hypothetical protein
MQKLKKELIIACCDAGGLRQRACQRQQVNNNTSTWICPNSVSRSDTDTV